MVRIMTIFMNRFRNKADELKAGVAGLFPERVDGASICWSGAVLRSNGWDSAGSAPEVTRSPGHPEHTQPDRKIATSLHVAECRNDPRKAVEHQDRCIWLIYAL